MLSSTKAGTLDRAFNETKQPSQCLVCEHSFLSSFERSFLFLFHTFGLHTFYCFMPLVFFYVLLPLFIPLLHQLLLSSNMEKNVTKEAMCLWYSALSIV